MADSVRVPRPFKRRNGQTYRPVAVAMYGSLTDVVPLAQVVSEDGTYWGGHTLLWALDNGRNEPCPHTHYKAGPGFWVCAECGVRWGGDSGSKREAADS